MAYATNSTRRELLLAGFSGAACTQPVPPRVQSAAPRSAARPSQHGVVPDDERLAPPAQRVRHHKLVPHGVVDGLGAGGRGVGGWGRPVSRGRASASRCPVCCARDPRGCSMGRARQGRGKRGCPAITQRRTFQLMPCPGMYSRHSAPYCRSGSSTPSSGYRCCTPGATGVGQAGLSEGKEPAGRQLGARALRARPAAGTQRLRDPRAAGVTPGQGVRLPAGITASVAERKAAPTPKPHTPLPPHPTRAHPQELAGVVDILEEQVDHEEQVADHDAVHQAPDGGVRPHHAGGGALHHRVACRGGGRDAREARAGVGQVGARLWAGSGAQQSAGSLRCGCNVSAAWKVPIAVGNSSKGADPERSACAASHQPAAPT